MARSNEDHVIIGEDHRVLLDILKAGPTFDFELYTRFGDELVSLLRDLRTNEHPIHSLGACDKSHPCARIHYFDKPGAELAMCITCKSSEKERGPFCSESCQLRWEEERLSELSSGDILTRIERERRLAKAPERYRVASSDAQESVPYSHRPRGIGSERLSTTIPPHLIGHLAKKAAIRGSIPRRQISVMVRVAEQLYNGVWVSEGELRDLDLALAQCLDTNTVEAECHDRNCGMCRLLVSDLDHLNRLRNRMISVPPVGIKSAKTSEPPQTESRPLEGSSLFPPLPIQEKNADPDGHWTERDKGLTMSRDESILEHDIGHATSTITEGMARNSGVEGDFSGGCDSSLRVKRSIPSRIRAFLERTYRWAKSL
ncbi:MAG: hypothetical protein AB1793_02045 [Candidatus Thermoplasmatota archaeon]